MLRLEYCISNFESLFLNLVSLCSHSHVQDFLNLLAKVVLILSLG